MGRFYGLVHKWMASCKSDGIIGIVLGGSISPTIHFAGTLKYKWIIFSVLNLKNTFIINYENNQETGHVQLVNCT